MIFLISLIKNHLHTQDLTLRHNDMNVHDISADALDIYYAR